MDEGDADVAPESTYSKSVSKARYGALSLKVKFTGLTQTLGQL
jgi:hypothetical protein